MKLKKGDIFIIAFIIFIATAIWLYPVLFFSAGKTAVITYDAGEKIIPLEINGEYDFDSCKVKVENGEISVVESDCPDKVCIKTGKISREGSSVICVPNKFSIRIEGESDFDAIAN